MSSPPAFLSSFDSLRRAEHLQAVPHTSHAVLRVEITQERTWADLAFTCSQSRPVQAEKPAHPDLAYLQGVDSARRRCLGELRERFADGRAFARRYAVAFQRVHQEKQVPTVAPDHALRRARLQTGQEIPASDPEQQWLQTWRKRCAGLYQQVTCRKVFRRADHHRRRTDPARFVNLIRFKNCRLQCQTSYSYLR